MHEYFYSVDFNLRNPTKFSLHFSHFSLILYEFCKSHSNQINKTKPTPTPTDPRAPPAEQQREQGLLCSAPAAHGAHARRPWGPAGQLGRTAARAQGGGVRLRPSRGARGAAHRGARGLGRRRTRQGRWQLAAARSGAATPASARPGGSGLRQGEPQRGRAVPARVVARPHAARARPAACGGRRQRGHRRRGDIPMPTMRDSGRERNGEME